MNKRLKPIQLEQNQMNVLAFICSLSEDTPVDYIIIAANCGINNNTASRSLTILRDRGLIDSRNKPVKWLKHVIAMVEEITGDS